MEIQDPYGLDENDLPLRKYFDALQKDAHDLQHQASNILVRQDEMMATIQDMRRLMAAEEEALQDVQRLAASEKESVDSTLDQGATNAAPSPQLASDAPSGTLGPGSAARRVSLPPIVRHKNAMGANSFSKSFSQSFLKRADEEDMMS